MSHTEDRFKAARAQTAPAVNPSAMLSCAKMSRWPTAVCGLLRFNHLRDLIPNKEKLDKAAFLMSTMDYIKQLQVRAAHLQCMTPVQSGTCGTLISFGRVLLRSALSSVQNGR